MRALVLATLIFVGALLAYDEARGVGYPLRGPTCAPLTIGGYVPPGLACQITFTRRDVASRWIKVGAFAGDGRCERPAPRTDIGCNDGDY